MRSRSSPRAPSHHPLSPRHLAIALSPLLALLSAGGIAFAAPGTAYVAERDAVGAGRIFAVDATGKVPAGGLLDGAEWLSIPFRRSDREDPASPDGVRSIQGELPRLQVRSDFQTIAFHREENDQSGIGSVGPGGVEILVSAPGNRYRLLDEGAALSPGGRFLAAGVRGDDRGEVIVLDLSLARPSLLPTEVIAGIDRIEPRSIILSSGALYYGARDPQGDWRVYRVSLLHSSPLPLAAEAVAGPFPELSPYFASSTGAAAFLAGEKSDALDVYAVRESGPAENVTRLPEDCMPHSPDSPRLAISGDGTQIAYHLRAKSGPETYLHRLDAPGVDGRRQVTADVRFNPYIDQESLIFFTRANELIFAAGHDPVTMDLYRVDPALGLDQGVVNLTQTGSGFLPPFLTKGTLTIRGAIAAPGGDLVLVAASGFTTGASDRLLLYSSLYGSQKMELPGLSAVAESFAVGVDPATADLYFTAARTDGERGLFRWRGEAIVEIGHSPAANPPRLFLHSPGRAFAILPGTGLLDLEPLAEPRTICPGDSFSPAGAISRDGTRLLVGVGNGGGGFDYFLVEIATGAKKPFADPTQPGGPLAGDVLALSAGPELVFIRGDADGSGLIEITDVIHTLNHLFIDATPLSCPDAADANDDGEINISDPVFILFALFAGGPPPPAPYPLEGADPTPDNLAPCSAGG